MAGIQVPVSLQIQNLQSLVTELQNKLSNLKVGSTGFKNVQNLITGIKNEIDKLQVQTSKPFINESQFTKAENSVDKLEDELKRVEITLSRIKFSDLELNPQQKAELKAFEDQINAIKASLKTVKDTAKQDFLNSDMGKIWSENFDKTAITKTFSEITKSIRSEVTKQQNIVKDAEQALKDYQNAMKANDSIKQFLEVKNPLEETNLGVEKYAQIFQETKNGLRFRAGGSTILEEWLKSQLNLDDATIKGLIEGSAQKVKTELEKRLKAIQLANTDIINNNTDAETNHTNEEARLNQLNTIMQQLGYSEQSVAIANQALRQQLSDTNTAMSDYQDQAVQAARSNQEVNNTTNAMKSQLDSLRSTLQQTNGEFIRMQRTQQSFNQMKMAVVNFMGFNQVLNLTRNAVRNAINHIRELDTVMNGISIVTDMSTSDLWNQVDAYSKMAQTYGVSIKGAYEVSQIYYQQGLQTNDVLTLTNETLKLAKISGLDYATTTDYMTTAIRGFKLEMSEASRVVDVYSNLAAHTAVSQEELAVAMSKTASSMEAVGATFEEASAMIGTMVAVTRESATNIGSAMKSIASRYGELTKDPTKLVDEEGEAMAFNKVDAALQSVGISMRTVDGQFREFTDVIVELGEKWDQLDSVQQRYIATQFAGNRQQSRFLALVSNVDLLKSNLDVAMNSEDTGTLQALKALDSIEAKTEQVRVAYQQFYTTIGAESVWKGLLDGAKNVINTLNSFPKAFGKIPLGAIGALTSVISLIKSIGIHLISGFAEIFGNGLLQGMSQAQTAAAQGATTLWERIKGVLQGKQSEAESLGKALGESTAKGYSQNSTITAPLNLRQGLQDKFNNNSKIIDYYQTQIKGFAVTDHDALTEAYQILGFNMQRAGMVSDELKEKLTSTPQQAQPLLEEYINSLIKGNNSLQHLSKSSTIWSNSLQSLGSALNTVALTIDTTAEGGKTLSGTIMSISGVMSLASAAIKGFSSGLKAIPWIAVASGAIALINGISTLMITSEERLEELTKKAEDLSNKAKESKAEYRTLDNSIKKIKELEIARYDSAEAAEEYQTAVDNLAEEFPILIRGFDAAGNAILDASAMEGELTEARQKAAEAAYAAAQAEAERAKQELANKKSNISSSIGRVRNLIPGGTRSTVLAQYQTENGTWQNIGAYGGENQRLYEKLSNIDTEELTLTQQRLLNWLNQNDEQQRYDGMVLARLLDESTTAASQGDYNKAAELNDMFNIAIQTMGWRMTSSVKSTITDFNNLMAEITPLQSQIDMANKQSINAWLRSSEYYKLPFIQQNSKLSTVAENQIYKLANGDYSKANLELSGQKVLSQANLFWNTLSKDMQDQFNTIFSNPENYTKNDITNILQDNYISESIIPEWLFDIFNTQSENIKKTLEGKLNLAFDNKDAEQYASFANMIQDENKQFTLSEQKFLIEILSSIQDLNLHGFDSSFLSDSAIGLINKAQKIAPELRKSLFDQIILNGFTAEGLQKTLNYISDNNIEIDTSDIELIATHIIPNISLSTQAILSNFKEQWEDINKLFSSLSSGVEQKDIEGIIQEASQYGINLSETDFQAYGDKFIVESNAINTYLNDMYIYYTTSFTNIKESLEAAYENLTLSTETIDVLTGDIESSDDIYNHIDDLRLILQEDFNKWFTQDEDSLEYILNESKTEEELWMAIQEKYEEGKVEIDKLTNFFSNIIANLKKTTAWQQGDYSSLLDTTAFNNLQDDDLAYEKLTARLYQLADLNTEWSAAELYEPDVKNAVLNIRKAYSSLLSDILNKGFENIDLSDYEGLSGISEDLLTGTYQKFIQTYISRAGLMIDEANDLLLQAIQKDRETQSVDLIKDLQFFNKTQFKTDLSSLNDLAKKLDVPLSTILDEAVISYNNALDEYIVDATKISNLDLSSAEFQESIQSSIQEFFESLASYISNALKGSLSAEGARELQDFATNQGIGELRFTRTADGLKVANDSAWELVKALREVDAIQGNVAFDDLKESLIESDDAFKSISSNTERIRSLRQNITDDIASQAGLSQEQQKLLSSLNGNIDIFNRPVLQNADGTISTLKTITADSRNYESEIPWIMNITPITQDGQELSDAQLDEYIDKLFKNANGDLNKVIELDKADLGLVIELADTSGKNQEEMAQHYADRAESLHEISDLIEQIKNSDEFDTTKIDQYKEELRLAQEILAARSTTEDDSFKFMDQKIPSGQNNPLNYWKNWREAFDIMQETTKGANKGTMAYEDFYNIVTEMGNIAKYTEDGINIGGQAVHNAKEASDLIEQAAAALTTTSTGDLVVDLGKIGINFASGVDGMAKGVDAGIDALADEQIKMLDSMIQLLETVVAMEELGKIDVEGNGLDFNELFDIDTDWITGREFALWRKGAQDAATEILKTAETNEDLKKGLEQVKVNGQSIGDILKSAKEGAKLDKNEAIAYHAALSALYDAMRSGDYNLDDIYTSIRDILAGTDFEGDIDVGDLHLTVHQGVALERKGDKYIVNGHEYTNVDTAVKAQQTAALGDFTNAIKTTNPETGETTYTAGELNATVQYDVNSKKYHLEFSDGTSADAADEASARFALQAWAQMKGGNLDAVSEGAAAQTLSFTYDTKAGVVANIEADVTTGKITYSYGEIQSQGQAAVAQELAKEIKTIEVPLAETTNADQNINLGVTGNEEVTNILTNISKILDEIKEKTNISITITDETTEALAQLKADLNNPENKDPIIKEVKARITEYINGEGEKADPNKLVSNLQGILTTYEPQIPEDQKKAIEGLIGIISAAQPAPNMTLPEIKDLVANLTIGKNEPKAALESNDKTAKKGVQQNINIETNATGAALDNNINAEDVTQNIINGSNAVVSKINDNVIYAKRNPAVQEIKFQYSGGYQKGDKFYFNLPQNNSNPKPGAIPPDEIVGGNNATGNIAHAKGTLMGELGPELVVQNGHYFVAGQNGAEFVDLMDDAIVFNHLQTQQLLKNGMSNSRGRALTNERVATAYAQGNINGGEAMASAKSALAALKQLRSMWQSLQKLGAKDLAGAGGSGGGGGGGGKDNSDDNKAFLKDLEKWYNWLQKIAQLESDITYQEQLRSKIQSDMVAHGQDYAQSQLVTLGKLEEQITTRQDLVNSQQEFFDKRRKELNDQSYPFSSLYEFDENGQLKYKDGQLAALSNLMGRNDGGSKTPGAANYTAKEQYQMIIGMNKDFAKYMDYNESGEYVWEETEEGSGEWTEDSYVAAVEAFWAKIEADQTEMQSIHDSIEEQKKAILADYEAQNEILHDIEDNQIAVENKVYDALVDSRERAIEELEKTKDAIEESANKLIDGLQKQLDNERDMYEAQNNKDELIKLQRQLSILQRSGASTSEMASLQTQITQKQQDNYFEDQQMQIDAIQEASNNELEKLQQQIDLETEMLAYEKENGLLWSQVYDIMHGNSADGIAEYIAKNNSEYWGKSPTEIIEAQREDLFKAQRWEDFTKKFDNLDTLINYYTNIQQGTDGNKESADEIANNINGSSSNSSSGSETKGTASGTVSNTGGTWKSDDTGWWYQYNGGSWATGWKNIDGKDYYFNDKGYMQTGWVQGSDGKWYYLGADGAMVTGTQSIDGKTWNFDENGVWDGKDGVAESTTTASITTKKKGWHLEGSNEIYGSKQLAKNAREQKIQDSATSEEADKWAAAEIKYYSEGGLDDYTGPVILHGTKTDPEAVLNASQTHILRDEILSNKPNSLLSLLSAWRDSVIGLADTSNINTNYDNGITIEKAEVIMQVHQIANDYDAQRAGEQALDKIMGIARKTIAQNRIGR